MTLTLIKHSNVTNLDPSLELREQRYLKHLASALSHYLEHPQGNELVFRLGSGYEKDNKQAMDTWVSYHRDEIFAKRAEGQNPLEYLLNKIEQLVQT
ncbi:hypothetical protein [Pseudomonas sp. MS19]|uniref:hypothetical protein n=1 Tax=Pseudomonas sp. MS19 TaxID=2579939 RepID=UPI001561F577|nr:hypothetical protein [Pseudomonas sp. MS19]NRH29783.1 hypothetical protein [Pseudomonas sp. MS19]